MNDKWVLSNLVLLIIFNLDFDQEIVNLDSVLAKTIFDPPDSPVHNPIQDQNEEQIANGQADSDFFLIICKEM